MKTRYKVGDQIVIVDSIYYVGEIGTIKKIGKWLGQVFYDIKVPGVRGELRYTASSIRLYKRR